jgi:hypothetical protein
VIRSEQETIFRWAADEDQVSRLDSTTRRKAEAGASRLPAVQSFPLRTAPRWAGFYRVPLAEFGC